MRISKILLKDTLTGMQVVATDTSYNHAMSYLCDTKGYDPVKFTLEPMTGYVMCVVKKEGEIYDFFYDEDRGYLLFKGKRGGAAYG